MLMGGSTWRLASLACSGIRQGIIGHRTSKRNAAMGKRSARYLLLVGVFITWRDQGDPFRQLAWSPQSTRLRSTAAGFGSWRSETKENGVL